MFFYFTIAASRVHTFPSKNLLLFTLDVNFFLFYFTMAASSLQGPHLSFRKFPPFFNWYSPCYKLNKYSREGLHYQLP